MGFKKILVPVDFSEFSDKAVEYAMFIAEKYCADITLLHAVVLFQEDFDEKEQLQEYEKIVQRKEKEREEKLKSHCITAEKKGFRINSRLIRGFSEADTVIDFISANDFDLVVMGTHGRTGLAKMLLGSVTERVVRLSPIPVITVHKEVDNMKINKILVPIDFSGYSDTIVERAIAIAEEFKAQLSFLHVVEMETHPEFYSISFEPILKGNPKLSNHIIKNMMKLSGIPKNRANYAVTEGKVYKEIKSYAELNQIDLIVMAMRGMSEIEHFLVGSKSERVVRIAPCPVLTIGQNE